MDSLLGGVLLSAWHRFRPVSFKALFGSNTSVLIACMALFLTPVLFFRFGSTVMGTIGLSGAFLAGAIAVGMAVSRTPLPETSVIRVTSSPVGRVGSISYNTSSGIACAIGSGKVMVKIVREVVFLNSSSSQRFISGRLHRHAFHRDPFLRMREKWYPNKPIEQVR